MNTSIVHLKDMISNHILSNPNGLTHILEWTVNAMMKMEQTEFLARLDSGSNKANGYRYCKGYGQGRILELRVPRDRNGRFYPKIMALLRSQQAEIDQAVTRLYAEGLTQAQIGRVFEDLYGQHYSQASISRMTQWMHQQVQSWRERPLQQWYPAIFVDAVHMKVRRDRVSSEAFYVVLAIRQDHTREVLAIESMPTESAYGWEQLLQGLQGRGMQQTGLVVGDGLKGLADAVGRVFPKAQFQRCVTHVKRRLLSRVRHQDKALLAAQLGQVFKTEDKDWTPQQAQQAFTKLCDHWEGQYNYRFFSRIKDDPDYSHAFTYLNFDPRVQSMLYTTNWIERLNRDFRRVTRMRASMSGEESVITLLGFVAMDKTAYRRKVPKLEHDSLFNEKFNRGKG